MSTTYAPQNHAVVLKQQECRKLCFYTNYVKHHVLSIFTIMGNRNVRTNIKTHKQQQKHVKKGYVEYKFDCGQWLTTAGLGQATRLFLFTARSRFQVHVRVRQPI
jgi:hypothetical protein